VNVNGSPLAAQPSESGPLIKELQEKPGRVDLVQADKSDSVVTLNAKSPYDSEISSAALKGTNWKQYVGKKITVDYSEGAGAFKNSPVSKVDQVVLSRAWRGTSTLRRLI
jgi:hypothetical protein